MLHFLFGRPGSGKTHKILEEIRTHLDDGTGRRVWLVVPEQAAYSAERDILSALPPEAAQVFSIISFSRLCDLVADRFGGRAQHTVTRAMRSLIMWENLRELRGLLGTYGSSGGTDASLCRRMLGVANEMTFSGITPSQLEGAADRLPADSPLRAKLRDISLITAAYGGLMQEIYGEDPADRLLRCAEKLERHSFFSGDIIYIDGFSSFTAPEYAVIHPMLMQAAEVTVSFGCAGRNERAAQTESLRGSIRRLTRLAETVGVPYSDTELPDGRRGVPAELSRIEEALWDFSLSVEERDRQAPAPEERGAVRLVAAAGPYDEAEAVALHILELRAAGVPYGEMAVVVRDTDAWQGILDDALERYDIPFFLSTRTDLNEKPAARLLLLALRCIARRWQREDLVALAKTGLCSLDLREIDYFSEYTETWGLTGRRMAENVWSMNPDGYTQDMSARGRAILEAANHVRAVLMTPLLELETELATAEDAAAGCRALFSYLSRLGVKEQLRLRGEQFLREGDPRAAGEEVRLWSFLCETLATVAAVLATAEPPSAAEYGEALALVFAETDIGSVPARHDCVTVGAADTLRVDNIRAMLIPGLCEGEFPRAAGESSLISEDEKATLSTLGIEFDAREENRLSDELLYIWRAMAEPTQHLILSHSRTSADGQARSPSVALSRVRYLLPYLTETPFSLSMLEEESVRHRAPLDDRISPETARRVLGDTIHLSQTQLQTYSRCPYSYYGSHILRLRERVTATFDNLGAGVFLHHVMEEYLRRSLDEDNRIRPMDTHEVHEVADAIITAYMADLCGDISDRGRLLHLFDRLREVAVALMESIQAELSVSAFRVAGLEWDTNGRRPGDPRPMVLDLPLDPSPNGLLPTEGKISAGGLPTETETGREAIKLILGGRVDRVDLYRGEDGETVYVRVVDYKSSRHEFSTKSVVEDMNIQLLLYLFTLTSPENRALFTDAAGRLPERVRPASAVYMSPDESGKDGVILPCRTGVVLGEEEILAAANGDGESDAVYLPSVKRNRSGALEGKGLLSSAQMEDLETLLKDTIRKAAGEMYAGCASRTPDARACRYCRVREACGARAAD